MSDDEPAGPAGSRRPYNRPRRYPVKPAAAPVPDVEPFPAAEVTRQNPSLAQAAQQYERRDGESAVPPAGDTPLGSTPYPYPVAPATPPPDSAGTSRAVSKRGLLVALAVLILIAVVGLVIGLSGGGDSMPRAHTGNGSEFTSSDVTPSAASSSLAPSPAPSTSSAAPGGATSVSEVCHRLDRTPPFTSFVADPRPARQMPDTYVEPQSGVKVGVCIGAFRPGAGVGRGHLAYLAEYQQLQAAQYAVTLKTLGWVLVPNLPRPTYRNNFTTTVTLVQQGTALVTVVGTGR